MADRVPRLPFSLVALIVGIAVVPLGGLAWVGLQLVEQDRVLEAQQARQRVERAADLAVAAIDRELAGWEHRLPGLRADWNEPAVALTVEGVSVEIQSAPPLAYWPVAPRLPEAPAETFAAPEAAEFRDRDLSVAAAAYRRLAGSADPAVRAGAIARLGRVSRKMGRAAEARAAFASLAGDETVAVHGIPASLLSAYAIGISLEASGARDRLREHGSRLARDLRSGRWQLNSDLYALYSADARRWTESRDEGVSPLAATGAGAGAEPAWGELLAAAAARVTGESRGRDTPGREVLEIGGQRLTVLQATAGRARSYLIASPAFVRANWTAAADAIAREHGVTLRVARDHEPATASGRQATLRTDRATGLPWTLEVASVDPPPERSAFARRRRWLLGGLALFGLMAASASYLIYRAVSREVAVARQQADFLAAVSHEFRTPLTTLRQFTAMLQDNPALPAERRTLAYAAQGRATDRLSRLVESLLDLGRLESGAAPFVFEGRDLGEIARTAVDDFRPEAAVRGHDVVLHAAGAVPVHVDADAMSLAIRNLLENAVKYSPDPHPIAVDVERRNGHAVLSVRDRGIGVPASERDAIFDRFRRGAEARALGIRGTGVGLAMVSRIVEAHRGRVTVDSEPGAGSTFAIHLPAED